MDALAAKLKGGDPHVCARCAAQNPSCCRLSPGEEEVCFPVSDMERERILDCAKDKGGFVQESNSAPFVNNLKGLFPREGRLLEQLFPPLKHHLRLATRPDGSCVFLGASGCVLEREARPHYCLLFPFWIMGERLTCFTADDCLAVQEERSLRRLLALLGTSEAEIRTTHGRLRLAWGLPPQEDLPLLAPSFARYKK